MDERRTITAAERRRDTAPVRVFADQREHVKRFLNELSEAADAAEREITTSVSQLLADVAADRENGNSKRDVVQASRVAERTKQLEVRQRELDSLVEEARRREAELAELQRRLESDKKQIADERRRYEAEHEDAARAKARIEEKLRRLESQEEELETERARTKTQRRRIAAELLEEREAVRRDARRSAADLQVREEELQHRTTELQRRAAELERRSVELSQLAAVSTGGDAALRNQLRLAETMLAERTAKLQDLELRNTELRRDCERARDAADDAEARLEGARDAERRLRDAETEIDDLRTRLADHKSKLADAEARLAAPLSSPIDSKEFADLHRRYEDALDDLQEAKRRCAALEQLRPAADDGDDLPMDWESQKRRMMATLESDYDGRSPRSAADRLTIEGTIQITDGIVMEREREIAALRKQLSELGDGAVGGTQAAAVAEADRDEIVRRHREEAQRLENECREKLRSAEIELSLERAKLARERSQLEERRLELDARLAQLGKEQPAATVDAKPATKSGGGRWLARLGLREKDE